MSNQKLLQYDIERELEGLTFNELKQIAILINEFYSKSNGKPTLIFNLFNYTRKSEEKDNDWNWKIKKTNRRKLFNTN